jgi:hypothetical protein
LQQAKTERDILRVLLDTCYKQKSQTANINDYSTPANLPSDSPLINQAKAIPEENLLTQNSDGVIRAENEKYKTENIKLKKKIEELEKDQTLNNLIRQLHRLPKWLQLAIKEAGLTIPINGFNKKK